MAEQVNVFVENKPGRIKRVTEILYTSNVNIRAMIIQDRKEFGVMKILVDSPEEARKALSGGGFACALKSILAVAVDDRPGGLYRLMAALTEENINILDAYGFVIESRKQAVWCFEVDNPDQTRAIIETRGFRLLTDTELYDL